MSIRSATTSPSPLALKREVRSVLAGALLLAAMATLALIGGGVLAAIPAVTGLLLFALMVGLLERRVAVHHPHARLGLANRITLVRMAVAFLIAGRALDLSPIEPSERWVLSALAAGSLLLDGCDGWAARWQGLASAFGARFDLEVDALLILVLSIVAVESGAVGPWVLAIGAMRYVYLGLARLTPALRRPPPQNAVGDRRRKTIAVAQSLALIFALLPSTSPTWGALACALALALLVYSFAADIGMLLSMRAG
jgi:phosphatidylglycerophosphate synthase